LVNSKRRGRINNQRGEVKTNIREFAKGEREKAIGGGSYEKLVRYRSVTEESNAGGIIGKDGVQKGHKAERKKIAEEGKPAFHPDIEGRVREVRGRVTVRRCIIGIKKGTQRTGGNSGKKKM